ncbi:MAG: type I restriction endonuclease subunit R [Candidatus Doudnabacteria bacterium]
MLEQVHFDEARQSQLPFVELLINLGYKYISREEIMQLRGNDSSTFLLHDIASKKLMELNSYEVDGKNYKFGEKDVRDAIDELENLEYKGLIDSSQEVFNTIMPTAGGKTIVVHHDGKKVSKNFRFIDFKNPDNNDYHVSVEFEAQGKQKIRPDIVCFVNGIPFAVIENKKSSVDVDKAFSQQNRNQGADYCPKLFTYAQLLVGTNGKDLRYGTTGTPNKFYSAWKEKGLSVEEVESEVLSVMQRQIEPKVYNQLVKDLNGSPEQTTQHTSRLVTEQDKGVVFLFKPDRLLDLTKNYIVFDAGIKKISRYQQYFAIRKIFNRINEYEEGANGEGKRKGGLIWHTQGSGKSLTMVMFVKALIEDPNITNPRVIVVTDRKDLDKQIKDTFKNCNLKKGVTQATSGEHLLGLIKDKSLDVITTLVHKFESASKKRTGLVDNDSNIFVLIDEAHRSQTGIANLEMNRIIPNACYIAFTGTPLMKKEAESWRKFGSYIDRYTIDDALDDKVILPLIYEGRYVDLVQNKDMIDKHIERITAGMSDKQKQEIQQYVGSKIIKDNPQRIAEIAFDIEKHFLDNFKGTGLKAQVVAPSKFSAVLFQRAFAISGKINTAVVISDEHEDGDKVNTHKKTVVDYLGEVRANHSSVKSYEDGVISSFKNNEDGVEIIIVVDKLLTGFDAPRNTVLYLSKDLRDHNLLQAIARVNRLFENEVLPKTAGFIVDYSENAKNIDTAMKLFGNYDEDDVKSALIDVDDKIESLEHSYGELHDIFKEVKGSKDDEVFIRHLEDEQQRDVFYKTMNKFIREFNECLVLQNFVKEFKHIDLYKRELKKFMELRKASSLVYGDSVDLGEYKQSLIDVLDKYVDAKGVELLTKQVNITDRDAFQEEVENLGSDKSKAEAIAAQTDKTIRENVESDPEFYDRFSKNPRDFRSNEIKETGRHRSLKTIKVD